MADNRRADFDAIKARADFRAVPARYGLASGGKGDQAKIRCPFHDDEEPSRSVNLATRVFNCFSCHHAGNVLDFVHRMETLDGTPVSLRHSALKIAELSGIDLPGGNSRSNDGLKRTQVARNPNGESA